MYKLSVLREFNAGVEEMAGRAAAIPSRPVMPRSSSSVLLRTDTEFVASAATMAGRADVDGWVAAEVGVAIEASAPETAVSMTDEGSSACTETANAVRPIA